MNGNELIHNGHREESIDLVAGIPMSWLRDIDAACDAFFARRGIDPAPTFREKVSIELNAALARRKSVKSVSSVVVP